MVANIQNTDHILAKCYKCNFVTRTQLKIWLISKTGMQNDTNYLPTLTQSDRFASRNFSTITTPRCNSSILSRRRPLQFLRIFRTAFSAFRSARQRFIPRNCDPGRDLLIFLTIKCSCAIWLQP